MKKIIKKVIFFLVYFLSPRGKRGAVILMYHSVAISDTFFSVSPEVFENQIEFLKSKSVEFVKFSELVERRRAHQSLDNLVCLTFDDGYEDNYLNAYPVLKKYSIPATIFVATGYVGSEMQISTGQRLKMMSREMVSDLMKSGLVECMPHGHTHRSLVKIDKQEIHRDILESQKTLESIDISGQKGYYFAYPYGDYNQETIDILSLLGFKGSAGVEEGIVTRESKFFELPRMNVVSETSFCEFACKTQKAPAYLFTRKLWTSTK